MRLVCVANAPIPYHTPLFNALAEKLDLHVLYMSCDEREDRFKDTWGAVPGFEHSYFGSRTLRSEKVDLRAQVSLGVSRRLGELDPAAVLVISWHPIAVEPLLWARSKGRGAVMWAESTEFSGLLRGVVSTHLRSRLVRRVDSFVANGTQAAEYLRLLKVPAGRIVVSRLPSAARPDHGGVAERRKSSGGDPSFVFVGRLISRKRPVELIEAFADVRRQLPHATLTIVGDGPLRDHVGEAARRTSGVTVLGRREGAELDAVYSEADVLVLPAEREVWGLVVNEALAHGLFVVATDEVGSAHDLLCDVNGRMLPAKDLSVLAPALVDAARSVDFGEKARQGRAATVSNCTPEAWADDVRRAVDLALWSRGRGSREQQTLLERHPVLSDQDRWDRATTRLLGSEASLVAVSRWIGHSRAYKVDGKVALLRATDVRTWSGEAPLSAEQRMLNHLGIDAELVLEEGFEGLIVPRVDGISLDHLRGQLELRDRARAVIGTARTVGRLHRRGVAHRDIRADNVIAGRNPDPELIDFDQAVFGNRLTVALADWIGIGPHGLSPNPFWKFALFSFVPKAQTVGQRLRTRLSRGQGEWMSPPSSEQDLCLLAEAWRIAQASRANAPGQGLAYYAFTYRGWHFPGERPWYLRWDAIRNAVSFDGKRVVDLGANMGLFSSFALLHGAREVVGVDHDPVILSAAQLVAQALGTNPILRQADLVDTQAWESETGSGDIVSCTSVRHWLSDETRLSRFLAQHNEIIYEGHGTLEEETSYLAGIGFERPKLLVETERGRHLLYGRKT